MRALVIPEDFTKDQYMLKPIIEAMFRAIGKLQAVVRVCQKPRFQGVSQVLDWTRLGPVIDRSKGTTDLFLLCVDRDGDETRRADPDYIEREAESLAPGRVGLESSPAGTPPERALLPSLRRAAGRSQYQPAEGRKTLAEAAARQYARIRKLCPEDIAALEIRLQQSIQTP
ncbi:MAG TPA: hypothetical protein VFB21_06465 [Chthonomonadaceae bacterium]|nr:hypothetical protein [Chthonomonadaceae bacterium]